MSQRASASRSFASATRSAPWPTSGAATPACVVEKNRGATSAKSPSARMRSTSTEPTIPRQPINPVLSLAAMGSLVAAQSTHYSVPPRGPEMSESTPQLSIPPEAVWGPTFDVGRATDAYIATIPAADRERVGRLLRGRLLDRPLGHAADGRPVRAPAALPVCRATARLCGGARPRALGAVAGRRRSASCSRSPCCRCPGRSTPATSASTSTGCRT